MKWDRTGWLHTALGVLIGVIVGVGGMAVSNRTRPAPIVIQPPAPPAAAGPTATPAPLTVFVNGQVVRPAVYELPAGAIVADAIEQAGGFAADAYQEIVNLAQPLADGMQINVPSRSAVVATPAVIVAPATSGGAVGGGGMAAGGRVNLNTATLAELEELPGVGPSTAQKIIDYREDNGPFGAIEEVMNVSGIGEAKFAEMEPFITVDQ